MIGEKIIQRRASNLDLWYQNRPFYPLCPNPGPLNRFTGWRLHSTEVTFAHNTQQPRVWLLPLIKKYYFMQENGHRLINVPLTHLVIVLANKKICWSLFIVSCHLHCYILKWNGIFWSSVWFDKNHSGDNWNSWFHIKALYYAQLTIYRI